jgi:4a-hydroxytetrahydrobiopterin dehydratase
MPKLTQDQIQKELETLSGWCLANDAISKRYDLPTYPDAVAAITRVGFEAEKDDHHPDVTMNWKRITFSLTTHDSGGLTEKDFALARKIESLLGPK